MTRQKTENRNMSEKKMEQAVVIAQKELAPGVFDLWLRTSEEIWSAAKPGQFVSVYSENAAKLLPRPISICEIDRNYGGIRLVYRVTGANTGTEEFSARRPGENIKILGPLGNGYDTASEKKAMLIGGGIGIPPMLELAKQLNGVEKNIVLGYSDSHLFLKDEFASRGFVYVATDDGSAGTKGTVIDAIRANDLEAEVIYACGPKPMLRAVKQYAQEKGIECYLSLEERMACGIGACLGCVCQSAEIDSHSRVKNKRVCKDGPVFRAEEVEL